MTNPPPFQLDLPAAPEIQPTPVYDTVIVDGSYLIHRILHAGGSKNSGDPPFAELMTSTGRPTGATYGCLKTLRPTVASSDFTTKDLIIIWDGRPRGLSPRRLAIYPDYKARDPILDPAEALEHQEHQGLLEEQRPTLCEALKYLGIPSVDLPYREGDDIIACATRILPGKLLIMSDDKDFMQLVSDNVHVYRAGLANPVVVNPENFLEKTKIKTPQQYLLFRAITGDSSDHIPGLKDVGDTTAERIANAAEFLYAPGTEAVKAAVETAMAQDRKGNQHRYLKVLEHLHHVGRNVALMDLREESMSQEEEHLFHMEIGRPRGVHERELIQLFQTLEFKSYLGNFADWVLPFRKLQRAA